MVDPIFQILIISHSCSYQRMANKFAKILSFVTEKQPFNNWLHSKHQVRVNWYLHCTSIVAVSDALLHSLLASQRYSPASLLLIFVNTRSLTVNCIWLPTLIQDIIGWGVPVALHDRVILPPSVVVLLCIGSMAEGSVHVDKHKR